MNQARYETKPRQANLVIGKLREQKVKDLSPEELERAFKHCVSPTACKIYVEYYDLKIEDIYD